MSRQFSEGEIRYYNEDILGVTIEPTCVKCVHFDPDEFTCTLLSAPIMDCWDDEHRFYVKRFKEEFIKEEDMKL